MALGQISEIQHKIYEFIVSFIKVEGRPPTNREIGRQMGITSTGHIAHHLKMLESQKWITRESRTSRGIKLTKRPTNLPIMGTIAAGLPLDIFPAGGHSLDLQQPFPEGDDLYVLLVKGHSMIDDYICNGDYVVIKPQAMCQNGDIVVATHLQTGVSGSATLKRFFQEQNRIRLQPANAEMEPIFIPKQEWDREWRVQGKVIAILRHYDSSL